MSPKRILVVEDEAVLRLGTTLHLKSYGFDVVGNFRSGEEAIKQITDLKPDLILMDIELAGDIDGIETVRQIHEKIDIPVVYLTVFSDAETIERAESTNPFRYMNKPFNEEELKFTIEAAIESHKKDKLLKSLSIYKETLYNIQGIVYRYFEDETVFFNDMLEKMTGFKQDELKNDDIHFLMPIILTEDRKKVMNVLNDSINLKKPFKVKYGVKNKNGEVRQFYEMGMPVCGINGKIVCIDGTVFDVTG